MIQLNRGNWLYWLASVGSYVEDARTENLFNFSAAILRGIVLILARLIVVLFVLSPIFFTVYWLGLMAHELAYVPPSDLLRLGWWIYGLAFTIYVIYALMQSVMCPSSTSKVYMTWRKVSRFFFRVKTSKQFAINFTNRDDE